jgi:ribosome biogenesis GTPase
MSLNDQGTVLWGYGGFYEVLLPDARITCKLRGLAKSGGQGLYPGDKVKISRKPGLPEGMIEEILPRHNQLQRPKIANVEQAILLFAAKEPKPDFLLLDRMLVMTAYNRVLPVICINKCDLLSDQEKEELDSRLNPYQEAGFITLFVSALNKHNIEQLTAVLSGKFSVFAGPSGIGKSSILNALCPSLGLPVGMISHRLQRGRHTTRHVKIIQLSDQTLVADTPGFSLLDLPQELEFRDLTHYYPDFMAVGPCRFDGCLHDQEPDCAVKAALAEGIIDHGRYQRYLRLLNELREREEKY